ncbi:MAG: TIGR02584 family CRISPR-associated protein [Nitrospirae bacterium]|nr:TIGR02584 family CRISPR-associated protein [Nitrospirota bacterium]
MNFKDILIFVAGTTPQIITETIYALSQKKPPVYADEVIIITTSAGRRRIENALIKKGILKRLVREYDLPDIRLTETSFIIVRDEAGKEIDDIRGEEENEIMGDLITSLIQKLTGDNGTRLHCSIAGGRKTMSFYLGAALQLFGRPWDKLYHVLVNPQFETNPEFFYKPKRNRMIECRQPDGTTKQINTKDAEIYLTDLPFIRLGNRLSLTGEGFGELVAEGQRDIDTAAIQPELTVNLSKRELRIGKTTVRMTPVQLAIYTAFLRQKLDYCSRTARQYCLECTECFCSIIHLKKNMIRTIAEDYRKISRCDATKAEEWRDRWSEAPAFVSMVTHNISKISRAIRKSLGDTPLLPYYAITSDRKYGDTPYGVRVEKEKIRIG